MASLSNQHRDLLHAVLENPYASNSTFTIDSKISDEANFKKMKAVYDACMDENTIKSYGVKPLQDLLKQFDAVFPQEPVSSMGNYKDELTRALSWLAERSIFPLIRPMTGPDNKNPDLVVIMFMPGGISLPKAQYKKAAIVADYSMTVGQMLQIAETGNPFGNASNATSSPSDFQARASDIVNFEKRIAQITADPEKARELDVSASA
jgi:endothelin-converting enzyme